jgi:hypothetical protein
MHAAFFPPLLCCESRHTGPPVRQPQHTHRSSVHAIEPVKSARHRLWFGFSSCSSTIQMGVSRSVRSAVPPAARALETHVGPRLAPSSGGSLYPATTSPPHPNRTRSACLFTSSLDVTPHPLPHPTCLPFPPEKWVFTRNYHLQWQSSIVHCIS